MSRHTFILVRFSRQPGVWLLAILASCLSLVAGDAGASSRNVRLGIYDNEPKVYMDADGRPAGLFVELAGEVAASEGWRIEPIACSWADCLAMLERGELDLMPDVAYSEERAQRLDFGTRAVAHDWSQVSVRPDVALTKLADLAGRRVALLRDGLHKPSLDLLMAEAALAYEAVLVDSLAEGYRALSEGRVDAAVANHFFAGWNNHRYGVAETPIVFHPVSLYFAAPRESGADLLATMDRYLDQWRQNPDSPYYEALRRALAPGGGDSLPVHWRSGLIASVALVLLFGAAAAALRWQVRRRTVELETANQRLTRVLDSGPCVLYALRREADQVVTEWVSPNIARLYGHSVTDAMKSGWWAEHVHPDDLERAQSAFHLLEREPHVIHDYRIVDAAGHVRHVRDEIRRAGDGVHIRYFGILSDVTELREQEAQLSFVTSHDLVTGLANRVLLGDRVAHAIQRAHRQSGKIALLFVDLDRFKHVNDSLGHSAGDQLLCEAAIRIDRLLSEEDTFARVGGDEFVVLLEDAEPRRATELAERIVGAFAEHLVLGGHPLVVTASVGIALHPEDGADGDTLLMHAELAMYEAKNSGRNTYRFFAPQLGEAAARRLLLETSLRQAAARGELVLHYQPQYELTDQRLVGLEALVRWQHPEQGLLPPGVFIGMAEEIGIIEQIDAWVLNEACSQLAVWDRSGLRVPRVSVNLSALELESAGLVERVGAVVTKHGLGADRLELEVTESVIMRDPVTAEHALAGLKALGVQLAVDDFGTGYSSLAYLKRLPIDRLKIDRSFVQDIGSSASDESIVRAIIALADSLGLETVAEGVETVEHAGFLRAEGCRMGQGYLFARPLPVDELAVLLRGGAELADGTQTVG